MGKSTSGPDWTDCVTYASQIEDHHRVNVTLVVTLDTSSGGLPLHFALLATQEHLVSIADGMGWSRSGTWPNRRNRTMEGMLYGLLMDLDEVLTNERWTQVDLPA